MKYIQQMLRQPTIMVFFFYHLDFFNVNILNMLCPPGKIPTSFCCRAAMNILHKNKVIVRLIHNFLLRSLQKLNITSSDGFGLTACSCLLNIFEQFDPCAYSIYNCFQTNVRMSIFFQMR